MKTLFQTQGYSHHSFRQATLLYEEIADDGQFDALCEQVAAKVPIFPEILTLLRLVVEQEHVRVLVITASQSSHRHGW